MIKNNKKGISLVEVLVVIAILAIITPMIFSDLLFGLNTYRTYDNYFDQHYTIMEATEFIRRDIQTAEGFVIDNDKVNGKYSRLILSYLPTSTPTTGSPTLDYKVWELSGSALWIGTGSYKRIVVDGIDTEAETVGIDKLPISRFTDSGPDTDKKVIFTVLPKDKNENTNNDLSVKNQIITDYSVRYKSKLPSPTPEATPTPT